MNTYKHLILLLMALFSCHSMAEVYKCKQPDGKVTFQDKRCPDDTTAQVVSSPNQKLCYILSGSDGTAKEVQSFWTQEEKNQRFINTQIDRKRAVFSPEQIESITLVEQKGDCALTKLVNQTRESFDAVICEDLHYLSDKGEEILQAAKLTALQNCESKIRVDGIWTMNGKKYPMQSAYVSYSKSTHQLKVTLFPFPLTKTEEDGLMQADIVDTILRNKPDKFALGVIFQLRDNVTDPQLNDVVQFQTFVANAQATSVRSYDQNWRQILTIKQFHLVKSKQGKTAQLSWILTDRDQQATINVSAVVTGDAL